MHILYELGLWILSLIALPKLLQRKYRRIVGKRLGKGLPPAPLLQKPLVWIHAVSLGETKAAGALARALKQRLPQASFVISSITETGHNEAKQSIPFAAAHIYLPFDFHFLAKRYINHFSPDIVLVCESDFWFNFLSQAKLRGAAIGLVNGKISERSARRFKRCSFFSKKLFDQFDLFCLQNASYRERFLELGVAPEKLVVTGNLKFDDQHPLLTKDELEDWKKRLCIKPGQFVLAIGSTHDPEEKWLLDLLKEHKNMKILLTPRHPERYAELERQLAKSGWHFATLSNLDRSRGDEQLVLMNAMGYLKASYQLSDVSIVGGSFCEHVGGHNILEPCWYGKPVVFGPHMHNQSEFVGLVAQNEAGFQVSLQELPQLLKRSAEDHEWRIATGQKGQQMMQALTGSAERTVQALLSNTFQR